MFPEIYCLFISIFLYQGLYKLADIFYKNNTFYCSLENDRKRYFQKNMVKASTLFFISVYSTPTLLNGMIYKTWDNIFIYRIGYFYSGLDLIGLINVKNLPLNSKIHHSTTILFSILSTFVDYNQNNFWIGLPVYCILSCYAFGVNYFLAQRLINPIKEMKKLIDFNIISYILLLAINWTYQIYNLYNKVESLNDVTWDMILYVSLILFVANDDIKLINFMRHIRDKVVRDK